MNHLVVIILTFALILVHGNDKVYGDGHFYQSEWAVQFKEGSGPHFLDSAEYENLGAIANLKGWYLVRHKPTFARNEKSRTVARGPNSEVTATLSAHPHITLCEQQKAEPLAHQVISFSDPLYGDQWHLKNTGQFNGTVGVDVNIAGAWDLGYSGNGVRIAFVDDGLQYTHPDVSQGFRSESSYDFNGGDSDPSPDLATDFHGTSCAGVAAARNNSECGVGTAYYAEIASIRLTAGSSTDAQRASALSYMYNDNHIFSASFAPTNTQYTVGRRGTLTTAAMQDAVTNGRGGKGSIFVIAGGNGGREGSNCNYNGYANAIETIAVGAIGNDGTKAVYGELCAALLVTAPSGNSISATASIRTTDLIGANGYDSSDCTSTFSGTSASCPMVAGIVALMLEANPDLTWRDVQHILATTAAMTDATDSDWTVNGAGYHVNHKYGFGRVDATAAVSKAITFTSLAKEYVSTQEAYLNQEIPDAPDTTGVVAQITISDDFPVETVILTLTITHNTSGDLQIKLTSPMGTESYLAYPHADYPTILIEGQTGPIQVGGAAFGPTLPFTGFTYQTVTIASPANSCGEPDNCVSVSGHYAIVNATASCNIYDQVKSLQMCGATGVFVVGTSNTLTDITLPTGDDASIIAIPSVQLTNADGSSLMATLTASPTTQVAFQQGRYAANDYQGWAFSSVRNWGESARGIWTVQVTDGYAGNTGMFYQAQLSVHGALTPDATIVSTTSTIAPGAPNPSVNVPSASSSIDTDNSEDPTSATSSASSFTAGISTFILLGAAWSLL